MPESVLFKLFKKQPPTNRKIELGKQDLNDIQYIKYVHNIG